MLFHSFFLESLAISKPTNHNGIIESNAAKVRTIKAIAANS